MNALAIDVGGTGVKFVATGESTARRFDSGPAMTAQDMVKKVLELTLDWNFDVIAIGYPGRIHEGRIVAEPHNLGHGWVGFDFATEFGRPVKLINDAAMQALGSYRKGVLLFLGFGAGLGSALVADGVVISLL